MIDAIKRKKELNKASIEFKNKNTDKKNIMFMEGVNLYIDSLLERENRDDLDVNTVFDHTKKINNDISDFFSEYKLSEVNSEVIENFITYMRKGPNKNNPNQNISEKTIANCLRTLNAILNFLVLKKIIPHNPYKEVINKPNSNKTKKELNYFKIYEAQYALKCLDKYADIRLKTFMNIIFSLGCRREECCGLRWCDVNFKNNEISFNYAQTSTVPIKFLKKIINYNNKNNIETNKDYNRVRTKNLKTINSYRTNYVCDTAINCLKKYYTFKIACGIDVKPTDFIFTNYREGRNADKNIVDDIDLINDNKPADPAKLSHCWRVFKEKYNIKDVDLHRIRHTVANILENNGVAKKDIAKMLGNTERVLEEFYTHVDVEDLKRLIKTIDVKLFEDVEYVDINIDLVAKIINEYPMESLTEEEIKKIDLITYNAINTENYLNSIQIAKNIILTSDGRLNYFMDNNPDNLKIKLETYKRFNNNKVIKIHKEKDISIKKDIMNI